MKILMDEFNKFWDDALGDVWYVEDDDCGYEDGERVDLSAFEIRWQGNGHEGQPNKYIEEREIDRDRLTITPVTLFERWKKAQTTTTIVAVFDVPNDEVVARTLAIEALGGKVKK